ncbi:Lectin-B [Holothuria leucospilota]|uniref:Lectin-B n=1 Tax=Holothuria leucospilota TaxID=206669 RepID=A0A9Q1C8J0_HOLLE|nr:Lectin-B [Holothuria leucospilota]
MNLHGDWTDDDLINMYYLANYRSDLRCGGSFIAPNGEVAECDPVGDNPCCSSHNWCGNTAAHCDCVGCTDYRVTCQKFRSDLRCGGDYLAANGEVAQCNPDGEYPCCSPWNWCGITADHCDCADCADYRSSASEYRDDYRCGENYLAPNGKPAKCDPNGPYPCCSQWNWCGNTADHCECDKCVDFRNTCETFRSDYRCGKGYKAPNGETAKCDAFGIYPCCSPSNWCGITAAHCDCFFCSDYRIY